MKKMMLILTLFTLFMGCKEDEPQNEQKPSIHGTW